MAVKALFKAADGRRPSSLILRDLVGFSRSLRSFGRLSGSETPPRLGSTPGSDFAPPSPGFQSDEGMSFSLGLGVEAAPPEERHAVAPVHCARRGDKQSHSSGRGSIFRKEIKCVASSRFVPLFVYLCSDDHTFRVAGCSQDCATLPSPLCLGLFRGNSPCWCG